MTTIWLFFIIVLNQGVSKAAQCTTRGRFPNHQEQCRGYTMCINSATGFATYDLTCPETFIFSHIENLCTNVTTYKCFPDYNCTSIGNFEDTSGVNCRAYIACVEGINGLVDARWLQCPKETLFSRDENACVNDTLYKCNISNNSPKITDLTINDLLNITHNITFNQADCLCTTHIAIFLFLSLYIF